VRRLRRQRHELQRHQHLGLVPRRPSSSDSELQLSDNSSSSSDNSSDSSNSDNSTSSSSSSSTSSSSSSASGSYTVQSGDTLSTIAAKEGVSSWHDAVHDNESTIGSNANLIYPGQVLNLG
jgi:LysM repeat protein